MEKILSTLIPSLVKQGIFGDVELKDIRSESEEDIGPQYGSTLSFINLVVNTDSREVILPLLIKIPFSQRPEDGPSQFMMESLMYMEILPNLCCEQVCYPKIYYSSVSFEFPEENVLIFENVKYKHYRNSTIRTFLDVDHIVHALKTIAKFHSFSFILKHENSMKFLELTEKMKKYSYDPEVYSIYNKSIYEAIERGIRGFEKENGPEDVLEDLLKALENPSLIRAQLSMAEEPFNVICHGDFCNNNVMYKYNEQGSPTDCILYDFQLSIYGNIAVELAFFLYMHTNSDSREKYWDSFMKIYWKTLREYVPNHIELPTFENFTEYFGTKAILGYIISSFFLPMIMDPSCQFRGDTTEEEIAVMKTIAGEEGEKAIVDILSHMHKKQYIHRFLKYLKTKNA